MAERDWERELAEIVARPDPPPADALTTVDLRDDAAAAARDAELAERIERIGASLLRLVDRRLAGLTDGLSQEGAALAARLDAVVDLVEGLASLVARVDRSVARLRDQIEEIRSGSNGS